MKTWMNRIGMALIAAAAAAMIAADGFAAEGTAATEETGPASGQHLHRAEPAGDRSGPVSGRAG